MEFFVGIFLGCVMGFVAGATTIALLRSPARPVRREMVQPKPLFVHGRWN